MRIIRIMIGIAALATLCGVVYGAEKHQVTDGDTLWDLSEQYYKDPYQWKRIYDANVDDVENPHWIFPKQELIIPDGTEEVVEEEPEPEPEVAKVEEEVVEEEPEPEPEVAKVEEEVVEEESVGEIPESEPLPIMEGKKVVDADSFIAPTSWHIDGTIVSDKDKKLLISQYDTVYVSLGRDAVSPGSECIVYRNMGKARDPQTGKFLGYEIRRIGRIRINDEINEDSATALVVLSYEPLRIGDGVVIAEQ